jgi:hypothetical protein
MLEGSLIGGPSGLWLSAGGALSNTVPSTTTTPRATRRSTSQSLLYQIAIGLCVLAVLLQGLWAGIFLEHDGRRDDASGWIDVHARGGEVAVVLALVATVVAFVRLRSRRDLWIGSAVLLVLLAVEAYLGGAIRDDGQDVLTAVHVPLALVSLGLAVWLLSAPQK